VAYIVIPATAEIINRITAQVVPGTK
jgi:hypothetical protein